MKAPGGPSQDVTPERHALFGGPTVDRVVDALGSSVLDLMAGGAGIAREVLDVQILAPGEATDIDPGVLVLAVGPVGDEEVTTLVRALAGRSAAGLVVRTQLPLPQATTAADELELPVLRLGAQASWSRVAEIVTGVLTGSRQDGPGHDTAGLPWGDLFSLANAISALLDSPVTIEDPFSRVLAFSGRQDEADEGRVQTILGRRVPEHYLRMLEQRGVFRALRSSRAPVFVEALAADIKPRVAIGVFAGDEPLGSIWAVTESLTGERARALSESAQIAALHLLRMRVSGDVGRRLQADLVAGMLDGGARADAAAARLLPGAEAVRVLAIGPLPAHGAADRPADVELDVAAGERALQTLRDAVAMHFASGSPRAVAAALGGVVYVVIPAPGPSSKAGVAQGSDAALDPIATTARALAAGLSRQWDVAIGIGPAVAEFRDLPRSRQEADHVLRVLRAEHHRSELRVASLDEVQLPSLLMSIAEHDDRGLRTLDIPVALLADYDRENGTELARTIEVFLDAWGNVRQSADRLHVHENTLRYRIQRACEIGGIDLADPDQRLSIGLALRLRQFRRPDGGAR